MMDEWELSSRLLDLQHDASIAVAAMKMLDFMGKYPEGREEDAWDFIWKLERFDEKIQDIIRGREENRHRQTGDCLREDCPLAQESLHQYSE